MASQGSDRIPPHNDDAERAVLCAMLIDENAIGTATQYLRTADFYSNAHRKIFEAVLGLNDHKRQADLLTVAKELEKNGGLDEAGGASYLADVSNVVPSAANVEYYAQIVQDCSLRRAMISLSGQVGAEAYNDSVDSRLLLEETQQKLFDLSDTRQIYNYKGAREIIKDAIQFIKTAYSLKREITGIPSGFEALDRITAGFQPAELIIIGARPGMGKTAIALTMAANISIRKKIPAAFFSLEMSDQSLMLRLISAEARIDSKKLRIGQITSSGFTDIWQAAEDINAAPLFFVDIPNMRITDIRAMSRRLRLQEKVEIIFIDYIGLIASDNNRIPRWEQISEVSRSLKSLARELGTPIIALSQLRREAEQAKQPSLADIRESGSIEQDADMVMLINRNRELEKTPEEQSQEAGQEVELLVAKNRNGMVGKVNLVFLRQYTRFENLAVERV